MTTMNSGGFGDFSQGHMPVEQRTSILAILSLILSLLGLCFPGLGLLGLIFGIVAMILIGQSEGRLGGRGISAAGVVLGLLFTVLWLGLFAGAKKIADVFGNQIVSPAAATMAAIEAGDWKTARAGFVAATADKLTDEDFEIFRKAYQDQVGNYQSAPAGFWEFLGQISQMGQAMSKFQNNSNSLIPLPMTFSNGKALIALQINPQSGSATSGGQSSIPITNMQFMTTDGTKTFTLYDPNNRPLPPGSEVKPGEQEEPSKAPAAPKEEPVKDTEPK